MPNRRLLVVAATCVALAPHVAPAQQPSRAPAADSAARGAATLPWRARVRYGGGPSVGAPPSDYTGAAAPARWCLATDGPGGGDLTPPGTRWKAVSRSWLRQVLTDTTEFGATWRDVLGGAPAMSPPDSVTEVTDEATCRAAAERINRDLLGWRVGPPPVVVFRVRDYLVAYPSNARMGEFGLAIGMSRDLTIRGVGTW
jgi:hypothetical protein